MDGCILRPGPFDGSYCVEARSDKVLSRHFHEEFGVGLMRAGGHRSWSGRGYVEAIAGDVISVNPGEAHDGASLTEGARVWEMVYLPPAIVGDLVGDIRPGDPDRYEFQWPARTDAGLRRSVGALLRSFATTATDAMEREQHLIHILDSLIEARPSDAASGTVPAVDRAIQAIEESPGDPHSLDALAALGDMSKFQLIRAFKIKTGLTPHGYLMQRRLVYAQTLMKGGRTLAQAAHEAGFCDQSHMTNRFVAKHGYAPGAWLSALRKR